jgi:hypothetical protein
MKISLPNCTIEHTFVCDDLRQERSGKWLVVGLYPNDTFSSLLPASIFLRAPFFLTSLKAGQLSLEIEALIDHRPVAGFRTDMHLSAIGTDLFPCPLLALQVSQPGMITFRIREPEGEWQQYASIRVLSAPSGGS